MDYNENNRRNDDKQDARIRQQQKIKIEQLKRSNEKLQRECLQLARNLKSAQNNVYLQSREKQRAKNSIRYQMGTALIESIQSTRGLLRLPERMYELYKESRIKGRTKSKKPRRKIKTNVESKSIIIIGDDVEWKRYHFKPFSFHEIEARLQSVRVTVVIPVYNAFDELKLCVHSVLQHTKGMYDLLLIDDCSTDPRVRPWLADLEQQYAHIQLIEHTCNRGFVATANEGLAHDGNDVVLLNSDTIVTDHWLDKLSVAAYTEPQIATVTPFSNSAGIFSVPYENSLSSSDEPTLTAMAHFVEQCSRHDYIHVPTGHGFCLYVRRQALSAVGYFDEQTFGRGYGEENDFCMRAKSQGLINVICDDCYIYHERQASFRAERQVLLEAHQAILEKRYPRYADEVLGLKRDAKLKSFRKRLDKSMANGDLQAAAEKKRILYVIHNGGGGTPKTNEDLMACVEQNGYDAFLAIGSGDHIRLYHVQGNVMYEIKVWTLKLPWSLDKFYSDENRDIYFDIVYNLHIQIVHIRHLFKHTFDIVDVCNFLHIPVMVSFHDFYLICPTINLINSDRAYCAAQCRPCDTACVMQSGIYGISKETNLFTQTTWQPAVRELFRKCDGFITTSQYTRNLYLKIYPDIANRFYVIEHGRDFDYERFYRGTQPQIGHKTKILLAGNISENKGAKYVAALSRCDVDGQLEFHCIGHVARAVVENNIIYHGPYLRDEFVKKIEKIKPSYIGIFSIWPETYCHILTEAFSCGIPCILSDIGTLHERGSRLGGVILVDLADPAGAYKKILENIQDSAAYMLLKHQACHAPYKSVMQMGIAYMAVYGTLLFPDSRCILYLYEPGQIVSDQHVLHWNKRVQQVMLQEVLGKNCTVCGISRLDQIQDLLQVPLDEYIVLENTDFTLDDLQDLAVLSKQKKLHILYFADELSLNALEENVTDQKAEERKRAISRAVNISEIVLSTWEGAMDRQLTLGKPVILMIE